MKIKLRDPISGLTHLGGAALGAAGLWYLLQRSFPQGSPKQIISFSVFGGSLVLLYLASALYHLLDVSDRARVIFRQLDHSMIFVLIAGTYTPFCALALGGTLGATLLAIVWALALVGFAVSIFWLHAPRWLSTGLYLLMGWVIMGVIVPLAHALSTQGFAWLLAGGLFYTLGAVVYAVKRPDPFPPIFGFHEIWHLFVVAGSLSHFLSVATLVSE